MEVSDGAPPHVAMFTTTGKGHLFPLVEFARKLLTVHNFTITIIIPDHGSPAQPQKDLLKTLPAGIQSRFLPPISLMDIPPDAPIEVPIVLSVTRSIPALCDVLAELNRSARISAFVSDHFGTFAFDSVKKLGIPFYIFWAGSSMALSFAFHLPELERSWDREYRDLPEPFRMPGCLPLNGSDFVSPAQDRKGPAYKLCMEICRMFPLVDGILVDSFLDLEPEALKALQEAGRSGSKPPVYPVGPLVRSGLGVDVEEDCLGWLDEQPDRSVLYVAFGSGGTLSREQLKELALGLDMSGQRFLMVARPPNDEVRTATYFTDGDHELPEDYLPAGFMEKITAGKKGFVVSHWAPQIQVLRHPAVGGFMTHCGWNSTLESIVHGGVPLIAWPLFAEQRMNAVLLCEGLKVAMRVTEGENGVVDRDQISRMVRSLIEGEEGVLQLRKRMTNLKEVAGRAWEDDASSTMTLGSIVEKWI